MYLSKLFNKVKGGNTVSMILHPESGRLRYYLTSSTVGYGVVTTGLCEGDYDGGLKSYQISLETVTPLIDHGIDLKIVIKDGELSFESRDGGISVAPMYVESVDETTHALIERFIKFIDVREVWQRSEEYNAKMAEALQKLEADKRYLEGLREMNLSQGVAGSGLVSNVAEKIGELEEIVAGDKEYVKSIEKSLESMSFMVSETGDGAGGVPNYHHYNLEVLNAITDVASRRHLFVSMCDEYATVSLEDCYLIQKCDCPVRGVSGVVLGQLIKFGGGREFYMVDDSLVYYDEEGVWAADDEGMRRRGGRRRGAGGTGGTVGTVTCVFMEPYMPNTKVDKSLILRGQVEEKYIVDFTRVSSVVSYVRGKYASVCLDMGTGMCYFANERDERMSLRFNISSANTRGMERAKRDERYISEITMARFYLPKSVVQLLFLFGEGTKVYVKRKKIIFEREGLYLVFGRSNV